MIVESFPPIPVLSDELPAVMFYENEDGEYYVPVTEEPDQRRAWMRCEASASLALVPDGRQTLPCSLCEVYHRCEVYGCPVHQDCPTVPCPAPEPTDVWTFLNVDDKDEYRAGLGHAWEKA